MGTVVDFIPPGRRLPHSVEAEMAVLGAVLASNQALDRVAAFLRPEHFAVAEHRLIYETVTNLAARGTVADAVAVKVALETSGELAGTGGVAYLLRLADAAVAPVNAGEYARLIHELYTRRGIIAAADAMIERAYAADIAAPIDDQLDAADGAISALRSSDGQAAETDMITAARGALDRVAEMVKTGKSDGISTGIPPIDDAMGGLFSDSLYVLAARPAMGKTMLAMAIARGVAAAGHHVHFFSLEMSAEQLGLRELACETGVSTMEMMRGRVDHAFVARAAGRLRDIARRSITIDDTADMRIDGIRRRARDAMKRKKTKLIVVDYLQLLRANVRSNDNRTTEVSEITRGLKMLAKELAVPVLAISQLNRGVESRENKTPVLADLRESGSIEQDADVVMFLHRDEYYLRQTEPAAKASPEYERWSEKMGRVRNLATVSFGKVRLGTGAAVTLYADLMRGQFTALATENYDPGF